jgi:PPOX class probable F420-dependent enzyme
MTLDTTTEPGARAAERLRAEEIVWLTTVREDGQPQPTPVWFLWTGGTFLIFSRPDAPKLRNIANNPKVALNLHADEHGGNVVRIEGAAERLSAPPEDERAAMLEKYEAGIRGLGMDPEGFAAAYSAAIRVTPTRFRVW